MVDHLTVFDALIESGFWVFLKIRTSKLCKSFHNMIIILFSTFSWHHIGQEGGSFENFEYLKKQKSILGKLKVIFHNFLAYFF